MGSHMVRMMILVHPLILSVVLIPAPSSRAKCRFAPTLAYANAYVAAAKPCAQAQSCGDKPIPFPFGLDQDCFLPGFQLTCNTTTTPPHIAIPHTDDVQVLSFDVSSAQIRVNSAPYTVKYCFDPQKDLSLGAFQLPERGPFRISAVANRLTAVGCGTLALVSGSADIEGVGGCVSECRRKDSDFSTCDGKGCCQTDLPSLASTLNFSASTLANYTNQDPRYPKCSYAFLVEKESYAFNESELINFRHENLSLVLDWGIGNLSCSNFTEYHVCGENAECKDAINATGYICKCKEWYAGNPYVNGPHGCRDVNECLDPERCAPGARCDNKEPRYKCSCPPWTFGDAEKGGCWRIAPIVFPVLGTTIGLVFLFISGVWFHRMSGKRRLAKLREECFVKNGGLLLSQHESSNRSRIFREDELVKATNNYHESRVLGIGAYGTVYKGFLQDGTMVAVKRSKVMDQSQIDQFINEVIILTQINHRNVVKLLGCCLETEVPLLVYEFICNRTLYYHIHEEDITPKRKISWGKRSRIATETAEALAYLHSSASIPIYHRDVKSANILLDDNFTAKVADFGASRLVPMDQTQLSTLVQGTLGYLDPEYFQSGQLTEKSDVYSFGVVLTELLTGEKPISSLRPKESSNLAVYFLQSMKNNTVNEILDETILLPENTKEVLEVAELVKRCLQFEGQQRPTMKEVAHELEGICVSIKQLHPCVETGGGCGFTKEAEHVNLLHGLIRTTSVGVELTKGSVSTGMPMAQPFTT